MKYFIVAHILVDGDGLAEIGSTRVIESLASAKIQRRYSGHNRKHFTGGYGGQSFEGVVIGNQDGYATREDAKSDTANAIAQWEEGGTR